MKDLKHSHLYTIIDTGFVSGKDMLTVTRQLLEGGSDIIQLRAKAQTRDEHIDMLDMLMPLFENLNIPLVINDHIDIALRHPKLGLHLGQKDLHPRQARKRLGNERILGYSTHTLEQAKAAIDMADQLDYFAIGPIYSTRTKPEYANTQVGLELIQTVAQLNPPIPFYCIGGITRERIPELKKAGGTHAVAISDLLSAPDIAKATQEMKRLLKA